MNIQILTNSAQTDKGCTWLPMRKNFVQIGKYVIRAVLTLLVRSV